MLTVTRLSQNKWPLGLTLPAVAPVVLAIEVQDTGIGIKPEDQQRLFGDFVRLDARRNRSIEGTGLGLALTRRFTARMGGTITLTSVYGKGSTFTAYLPLEARSAEKIGAFDMQRDTAQEAAPHATFLAPHAHILVVDDNEMNRFVAKSLLKETRAHVRLAASGRECLDRLRAEPYDLVLLDDMMPELSGTETLALLKKDHLADHTPVVALTANAIVGAKETYLAAGFDDYLAKPIDPDDLIKLLWRLLPKALQETTEAAANLEEDEERMPTEAVLEGIKGLYDPMLQMFSDLQPKKSANIKAAYDANDWPTYAIDVHALKSNALSIGAKHLSELAKSLELAAKTIGKDGATEEEKSEAEQTIHAHHAELMELYEDVAGEAKKLLAASQE